jgi:DNA-binding CsgD family transcriptional regulator
MEGAAHDVLAALTPRQIDVVRLVVRGLSNREVGERLGITEKAVREHMRDIYARLPYEIAGYSKHKRNQFCYAVGFRDGVKAARG